MPFTPLHLGLGMVMKSVTPNHFSLFTYTLAQIAIDIEPAIRMALGHSDLHQQTHSLSGALLPATMAMGLGLLLRMAILSWWNQGLSAGLRPWLGAELPISRQALLIGALFGVYSHVLMDATLYPEMNLYWPWTIGNPLLGWVSVEEMYIACYWLIAIGLASLGWHRWRNLLVFDPSS